MKDTSVLFNGAGNINVSGAIYNSTGSGSLSKQGAGTLTLSAANTHTGATTVSAGTLQVSGSISGSSNVVVNTGGTLLFGGTSGTDRINNSAPVNLNGGTLLTAGFSETAGILSLSGSSTASVIDLGAGASVLQFAASNGGPGWGSNTLAVWNWTGNIAGGGTDQVFFGTTTNTGLTSGQLANVSFLIGGVTYGATLLNTGELVPVPEPTALLTAGAALAAALRRRRR